MSDFEFSISESNERVVSYKGIQLSSFVDPVKEAETWIRHYNSAIDHGQTLFVLGLGSGHHLKALVKKIDLSGSNKRIIVIEKFEDLICDFKGFHPEIASGVTFHKLTGQTVFLKTFLNNIETPLSVITFAPAIIPASLDYQEIFEILVGRTPKGIEAQFKMRGVDHFFCPEKISEQSPADSYRMLAQTESVPLRWQKIFKMMGELIR